MCVTVSKAFASHFIHSPQSSRLAYYFFNLKKCLKFPYTCRLDDLNAFMDAINVATHWAQTIYYYLEYYYDRYVNHWHDKKTHKKVLR